MAGHKISFLRLSAWSAFSVKTMSNSQNIISTVTPYTEKKSLHNKKHIVASLNMHCGVYDVSVVIL